MLRTKSQEAADAALLPHIAELKEIVRWGNEASATIGALKLMLIGTREATEAIMDLVRTSENPEVIKMVAPLIILSPFRDEYRAELETFVEAELIADAFAWLAKFDPRVLENPTWFIVAEALEAQCACKQNAAGCTHIKR
jgi:hypothetical protein